MSINRRMDKDVVHIHHAVLLSHKKRWNNVFVATSMDLEIIILNEVRQKQLYSITCMWNLKNGTNELIYKTEIDSET